MFPGITCIEVGCCCSKFTNAPWKECRMIRFTTSHGCSMEHVEAHSLGNVPWRHRDTTGFVELVWCFNCGWNMIKLQPLPTYEWAEKKLKPSPSDLCHVISALSHVIILRVTWSNIPGTRQCVFCYGMFNPQKGVIWVLVALWHHESKQLTVLTIQAMFNQ